MLASSLESFHPLQQLSLLLSVDALLAGSRLALMDLARHWPGTGLVKQPLRRLGRELGNSEKVSYLFS
jgi:hypothetical protein